MDFSNDEIELDESINYSSDEYEVRTDEEESDTSDSEPDLPHNR